MKLIAAVSGGVDSVVMLHVLMEQYKVQSTKYKDMEVVVAHVDHGYREDSAADARFVEALAQKYGCQFVATRLDLPENSEATAREHRWRFLREAAQGYGATKIATAHHRDDVYETMLLNVARGTGRHGLTSLRETDEIMRPLLTWSKQDVYDHALEHRLEWVEDPTNAEDVYTRNQLRRSGVLQAPRVRKKLEAIYEKLMRINPELDTTLETVVTDFVEKTEDSECRVDRRVFNQLSYKVQLEVVHYVLTELYGQPPRDSLQVERFALGLKVGLPQTKTVLQENTMVLHGQQWSCVKLM